MFILILREGVRFGNSPKDWNHTGLFLPLAEVSCFSLSFSWFRFFRFHPCRWNGAFGWKNWCWWLIPRGLPCGGKNFRVLSAQIGCSDSGKHRCHCLPTSCPRCRRSKTWTKSCRFFWFTYPEKAHLMKSFGLHWRWIYYSEAPNGIRHPFSQRRCREFCRNILY